MFIGLFYLIFYSTRILICLFFFSSDYLRCRMIENILLTTPSKKRGLIVFSGPLILFLSFGVDDDSSLTFEESSGRYLVLIRAGFVGSSQFRVAGSPNTVRGSNGRGGGSSHPASGRRRSSFGRLLLHQLDGRIDQARTCRQRQLTNLIVKTKWGVQSTLSSQSS